MTLTAAGDGFYCNQCGKWYIGSHFCTYVNGTWQPIAWTNTNTNPQLDRIEDLLRQVLLKQRRDEKENLYDKGVSFYCDCLEKEKIKLVVDEDRFLSICISSEDAETQEVILSMADAYSLMNYLNSKLSKKDSSNVS